MASRNKTWSSPHCPRCWVLWNICVGKKYIAISKFPIFWFPIYHTILHFMPILSMSLALLCKSQLVVSRSFPFFQEKICFKLNLKYIYFVLKQTHLMKVFFFKIVRYPPKSFWRTFTEARRRSMSNLVEIQPVVWLPTQTFTHGQEGRRGVMHPPKGKKQVPSLVAEYWVPITKNH